MKLRNLVISLMLLLLAAPMSAEKKNVLTVDPVSIAPGGTGEIVVHMNYPTTAPVVGYSFKLYLPDGITPDTKSGKWAAGCITLSDAIHPVLYNSSTDEYDASPKSAIQTQTGSDGGNLYVWLDQNEKTPLKSTEGELLRIKVKAADNFAGGTGKLTDISLTNDRDVSLDLGNIADVQFSFITAKNVLSVDPVTIAPGRTGDIVVRMNYDTDQTVVGYSFKLSLPQGIVPNTKTGNWTAACVSLSSDIHPLIYNVNTDDFDGDPIGAVECKTGDSGTYLLVWLDKTFKTALKATNGELLRISVKATSNFAGGTGSLTEISLANDRDESLDLGNIADVQFEIKKGTASQVKNALSVEPVSIIPGGTGTIKVRMDYDTDETVVGYGFKLFLPEGIVLNSSSGKWRKSIVLSKETHPTFYDEDYEDYFDPMTGLTVKSLTNGGYLLVWLDQSDKTPLASTHGELMQISVMATSDFEGGKGSIEEISFTNEKDVSLDLGNIADVEFDAIPKAAVWGDLNLDGAIDVGDISELIDIMRALARKQAILGNGK